MPASVPPINLAGSDAYSASLASQAGTWFVFGNDASFSQDLSQKPSSSATATAAAGPGAGAGSYPSGYIQPAVTVSPWLIFGGIALAGALIATAIYLK